MFFYTRYVYRYIYTKIKPNNMFLCSDRLVQVSGNEAPCSDAVVFWCTSKLGLLIWQISTTTRSDLTFSISSGTMILNLEPDSSLVVAQVTFNNGSFINATVTIMRPINLTGMISCNEDTLTLNILANTGTFLVRHYTYNGGQQFTKIHRCNIFIFIIHSIWTAR